MLIEKAWISLLGGDSYADQCPDGTVGFDAAAVSRQEIHFYYPITFVSVGGLRVDCANPMGFRNRGPFIKPNSTSGLLSRKRAGFPAFRRPAVSLQPQRSQNHGGIGGCPFEARC